MQPGKCYPFHLFRLYTQQQSISKKRPQERKTLTFLNDRGTNDRDQELEPTAPFYSSSAQAFALCVGVGVENQ